MKAIIDFLIGKKTYIICIAIGIVYTLQLLGIIPVDTAEKIIAYLAALGGITLAAKINRIGKPA